MPRGQRAAALLAGAWAGLMLCIGLLAAPTAFDVLPREMAGRVVARLFAGEAYSALALCAVLFAIARRQAARRAAAGTGSVMSAELLLVMGALFCTVAGYFAIQPMMDAARAGQGSWSFGALHAASTVLFGLKGLVVLALAWRLTGR